MYHIEHHDNIAISLSVLQLFDSDCVKTLLITIVHQDVMDGVL